MYCSDVYQKVGADFNKWLVEHNLPVGAHASIKDTSEMLYLGGDKGFVRKELIATAVGEPAHKEGETGARHAGNGISGDARQSSVEIGKVVSEMKVEYAVAQIRRLLAPAEPPTGQ